MSSLQSLDFLHRLAGPVVATNFDGVALYWSEGAGELLGFTAEEMRFKNWWEHLPAAVREQIKSAFARRSPTAFVAVTCPVRHKDGHLVAVALRVTPLIDDAGTPNALLALCHPAPPPGKNKRAETAQASTQAEQNRDALFQAQKAQAIGALASGVAHDFNNNLAAILSHLDLLLFAPELPASLREYVVRTKTSAARAAELVSRLLSFSRQSRPTLKPLQLPSLFDEVFLTLRRSVEQHVEIRPLFPPQGLWPVNADASHMMQVITNLCLNARDAMPGGGVLAFDLSNVTFSEAEVQPPRRAGEFVRLTLSDTGKGIPPHLLPRLFEPYFTTKEFGKGTGLGLSIASSIVSEHGGWMEVESEVGRGSRFHVFLPRSRQEAASPDMPRPSAASDTPSLEGTERILLVEDEEMVRLVARAVLGYRGYQIVEAVDGEEAVRKFSEAREPFDLVLMDVHMPRLNGWDALAQIRGRRPDATVIMLSGGPTEEFSGKIHELGAAAVMHKPFDNIELLRLVRRTLDAARKKA